MRRSWRRNPDASPKKTATHKPPRPSRPATTPSDPINGAVDDQLELDPINDADGGTSARDAEAMLHHVFARLFEQMGEQCRAGERVSYRGAVFALPSPLVFKIRRKFGSCLPVSCGECLSLAQPEYRVREDACGDSPTVTRFDPFQPHTGLDPELPSKPGGNGRLQFSCDCGSQRGLKERI